MPRHLKAEYPDSYGDQIKDSVRANIRGREVVVELPNARTLSRNLHTMEQGLDRLSTRSSHLLMQMGQFVDHDIILTPEGELNCCLESLRDDPLCANIKISGVDLGEDHIYRESRDRGWRQRCLKFTRSDNLCTTQAQDGSRTQLNALTSFLDMSAMYGSHRSLTNSLRPTPGARKRQPYGVMVANLDRRQRYNLPTRIVIF